MYFQFVTQSGDPITEVDGDTYGDCFDKLLYQFSCAELSVEEFAKCMVALDKARGDSLTEAELEVLIA